MSVSRRKFMTAALATATATSVINCSQLLVRPGAAAEGAEPKLGDDGLYHQDWFLESFLELKSDAEEAIAAGKHFAVIWEQRGCPYCKELHRVNFAVPKVRKYIQDNFEILQLDLWGPRKVTDFDGKEMGERELARRWRVNFTPTVVFFPNDMKQLEGKSGRDAEVWRLAGYFKPFHFLSSFEYVRGGHYKTTQFQRFLQDKGNALRAKGEKVDMW